MTDDLMTAPEADGQSATGTTVTDPKLIAALDAAAAKAGNTGQPVTLSGADFLSSKDPGYAAVIKAIAEGRRQAPTGMALRTPYGQKLAQDVYQYDPTADDVNLPARLATRKAFVAGVDGRAVTSQNTAIGHLFSFARNVEAMKNGSFPAYNALANSAGAAFGNKDIQAARSRLGIDRQAVAEELGRAFKGAAPDVHGTKGWEALLDPNGSPTQLRAAVAEAAGLLESRVSAIQDRYHQGMGTTSIPLPMLTPHALEGLKQLQAPDYQDKGYAALSAHPDGLMPTDDDHGAPPAAGPSAPVVNGGGGGPTPPVAPTGPAASPGGAPKADLPVLSEDGSSDMVSSRSKQFAADATALLNSGRATRADFDALATKYGFQGGFAGTGADLKQLDAAIAYANLGKKGASVAAPIEHTGPGLLRRIENATIGGQAGSILNTAGVGWADTGSFGLAPKATALINAAGDKLLGTDARPFSEVYGNELADAHARIDAAEAAHPLAALTGQAAGFVTGDGLISRVPGVAALAGKLPGIARPIVGDAITGAAYGAGSQDHLADVPLGVLKGAGPSAAGGVLGRGVLKGAAALASPVVGGAVRRLTDAGVTLTPGQVLGGLSGNGIGGYVGRAVKGIEDRLTGYSGIGDIVNATRRGGVEDFNLAAINSELGHSGVSLPANVRAGHQANAAAIEAADKIYADALAPLSLKPDAQLATDLVAPSAKVAQMSKDKQREFGAALTEHVDPYLPKNGAPLSGQNLQYIKQGLDSEIATYRKSTSPGDQKMADRLSDVRDAYLSLADRGAPAEAEAYRNARKTYGGIQRFMNAASKTKEGIVTPNQYRQAIGQLGYGTTKRGLATNTAPGQSLSTDASLILPSSIADSGTAGRAALGIAAARLTGGAALGGAGGYYEGGSGVAALSGAVLGGALLSRPGAKTFQYLAAGSRGKGLNTLGDVIRRNSALGGAVGAPALLAHRGN